MAARLRGTGSSRGRISGSLPPRWRTLLLQHPLRSFVGFGTVSAPTGKWANRSMSRRLLSIVLETILRTRQRAILLTSGAAVQDEVRLPDNVFAVDSVPLDWLSPRVTAAIRHGGLGTTAATLLAGIPSVTVPFRNDQPFWATRVYQLGAGPRPPRPRGLTTDRLVDLFTPLLPIPRSENAPRGLGRKLAEEDGVRRTVEIFRRYF